MSFPISAFAEEIKEQKLDSTSDTESYDEIDSESLAIADLFDSVGISANELVKIFNLTPKEEGFYSKSASDFESEEVERFIEKSNIQLFQPIDENQIATYDGDAYDGNPPYTKEEQQQRLEYIKNVFDKEYSAEGYQPIQGKYLAYLYTSQYIENINFRL